MRIHSQLRMLVAGIIALGLLASPAASAADAKRPKPWEQPYTGDEATGAHVLALWQFDPGAETKDSSGKGHTLEMRGHSRAVKSGRFGGALECTAAPEDKPEGAAVVKRSTALSPKGAFTAELWVNPKPEMEKERNAFLLDCKYYNYVKALPRANTGYVFLLQRSGAGKWRPWLMLGFGDASEIYTGRAVELDAGAWHHLAFTYDGAGTARIYLGGKDIGGSTNEGRGDITPTVYPFTIGGRYGSLHHGTPALFDQVRITRGITIRSLAITIGTKTGRTAFYRMEKTPPVQVTVRNDTGKPLTGGVLRVTFGAERRIALPTLAPKQRHTVDVAVDTTLRPGSYDLAASATGTAGGKLYDAEESTPIVIVPRPLPNQMPVVMWGGGDFEHLKQVGFTHRLVGLTDSPKVWEANRVLEPREVSSLESRREMLNRHLAEGIGAVLTTTPGRHARRQKGYTRVDRAGKPYDDGDVCASNPRVQQFCYNVGATAARAYGHFPAFQAALIHSEVRGHTDACFHDYDREAFRKFAGYPIPRLVTSKACPPYSSIPGFPADRVVPDDDPILTYYRWFWERGDGWNGLHTQVHKGLKSTGRSDLWTFYDPAVRVPSKWGSGGGVDYLSQWTYCYPDPIKIGESTDELFAMAEGRPGQQVMKMTQIIWYRNQTAPSLPTDESKKAQWEKDIPDARFITIAPDHMREAFWSKISRPIKGIMYHGWGSLFTAKHGSYRHTNPATAGVLAQLVRDVVRPLGPTLLQVPDRKTDVAMLESFTSQVFAHRGSWGWSSSWEADMHLILQWAQLQPRIVYDETILRDGLDGYRVLVMPHCDVLTASVAKAVAEFQRRGGIIVADEFLTPALNPDILIQRYKRTRKAHVDKAALQARAAALREQLDAAYTRYGESDNPDIVVRFRRYRDSDYLFAINDKRTYGTYVGHHGRVMEKGLPNAATLTVRRKGASIYDLLRHKPVSTRRTREGMAFDAKFGPTEGRLFLITARPIARLRLRAPRCARLGEQIALNVAVQASWGRTIRAIVPVQVEILDPKGRPAELSGYYAAKDGRLTVEPTLASNDLPGEWTIRVTELASGRVAERTLSVAE